MENNEHDDVRRLRERLEGRWEERDREKMREALRKERDVNDDTPASIFYCRRCQCDFFPRIVFKSQEEDWNTGGTFRYWKAFHRLCGEPEKRLISDKLKDNFWRLSPSVKRQRAVFMKDMLQPQETGFNMLYGRKNEQNKK